MVIIRRLTAKQSGKNDKCELIKYLLFLLLWKDRSGKRKCSKMRSNLPVLLVVKSVLITAVKCFTEFECYGYTFAVFVF